MAKENYFDRMMPRRSLAGFRSSASSLSSSNDGEGYSASLRRLRQHYLYDTKLHTNKVFSSPSTPVQPISTSTVVAESSSSEKVRERTRSITQSPSRSSSSTSHYQSSIDLMASSLKCDDCQTNDGLFQCCHCNQRLCIRCCNKHYKKVTIELERLHELSDRLVAKIVHTKNDLERQKNETLEQCHKWRIDTINTINKAHTLIVQTIHEEYETLGKEYEVFVQKEMAHIHIDQNELMRMKKGNLGSLLSTPSSNSTNDSTNSIETIRKRIETFAKHIDETGKFLFQVKLPTFDIDDSLRVESRFGDVTRSTSATWQNSDDRPSSSLNDRSIQEDKLLLNNVQSTETDGALNNDNNDVINNTNDEIEELPDKVDEHESDSESHTTTSSPLRSNSPKPETNNNNNESNPISSSRYALSVENDIELQQQQYYSPTYRGDRYDSAYGTAPSSPSSSSNNQNDHYFSTSVLHDQPSKKFFYSSNNDFGSFYNNRRHTRAFNQKSSSSRSPSPTFHNNNDNDNEESYRSLQHVQLKRDEDGSLEGMAIQIEQSHQNDGIIERRRTCMQACGVRRRTTWLPPRSPSSTTKTNTDRSSNDPSWLTYRTPSMTSSSSTQ